MAAPDPHATFPPRQTRRWSEAAPVLALAAATSLVLLVLAPAAWLVILTDGVYVTALLVAAGGWGAWPAAVLGLAERRFGQQVCVATAVGSGMLSLLGLILGVFGWLNRPAAWGLVVAGTILGLLRIARGSQSVRPAASPRPGAAGSSHPLAARCIALLPLGIPLAIMLAGATLPPGVLWTEEARGYDALEYHLQVPREYFDAGRIQFLPHNVYASFPQQVETLYLLLMHLTGDPLRAAIPAQLLHAAFGVLTVAALASWAKAGWPRVLVALVGASVPWLGYLGCLAYVELAMLFFATVGALLILDHSGGGWRTALTAGLCAGLAGGCKYTAVVMVAASLPLAWLVMMSGNWFARLARSAVFAAGVLVALSPWLVRNTFFAGNPVYPFAYRVFGGTAWSADQDAQWQRGHQLPSESDTLAGRARVAADELFWSGKFGVGVWLLGAIGLVVCPRRRGLFLLLWLALILTVWVLFTQMPGRFAVLAVLPLVLMWTGEPAIEVRPGVTTAVVLLAAASAVWNGGTLLRLWRDEERVAGVRLGDLVGASDVFAAENVVNRSITSARAYVWLVGDAAPFYLRARCHYTVVFSRDPWIEYAAAGASPGDCVAWLRTRNVTHVVFSWREIRRLRRTYGFASRITPAWVADLEQAGLRRILPAAGSDDLAIYEVVPR